MTVGVVGAGITGLSLTHYLRQAGVESHTFESASRPGGVIRTVHEDGRVLELGPQRTRHTSLVADLVDDVGLRDELVVADKDLPLFVYADGRLRRAPLSIREFLTTDLLSWRGKLRLLAEPLTAAGDPEESAAELFTRKFGAEAYHNLIAPLYGGIFGSDPAEMPAKYALTGLLRLEREEGSLLKVFLKHTIAGGDRPPAVSFADGMAQLPRALYEANDDRISLETPVETVGRDGDGYVLQTPDDAVAVDEVVLTTPADATASMLDDIDPDAGRRLRELHYNPLVYVHLEADCPRAGLGYQVRRDEELKTLGVSWNCSAFGRDGVYTCFLGGMNRPALVDEDEATLAAIAREEFADVMGLDARVLRVTKLPRGFPAYDTTWTALDGLDLPDGLHLATNYTARMGVPSRIREAKQLAAEFADVDR